MHDRSDEGFVERGLALERPTVRDEFGDQPVVAPTLKEQSGGFSQHPIGLGPLELEADDADVQQDPRSAGVVAFPHIGVDPLGAIGSFGVGEVALERVHETVIDAAPVGDAWLLGHQIASRTFENRAGSMASGLWMVSSGAMFESTRVAREICCPGTSSLAVTSP